MRAAGRRSAAVGTRALLLPLLPLLLAGRGGCLRRQELFPYGPENGDLELESGDDLVSPALELSTALRFFDKSDILSVYVSAPRARRRGPRGAGVLSSVARPEAGGRRPGRPPSRREVGVGPRWPPGSGRAPGLQAQFSRASTRPPTSPLPSVCLPGVRSVCAALRAPCRLRDPATSDPGTLSGVSCPALYVA